MTTITNIIERLEESPMFYLFSSSKELFHSNFWYWLYTIKPRAMLRLFSDSEIDKFTLERERSEEQSITNTVNNDKKAKAILDLAFIGVDDNLKIIVENKVKDFPRKDQLKRIQAACDDVKGEYVLATLFTFEGMQFDKWNILTYKEIADKIEPENFTSKPYHKALIEDYTEFLKNLANLANADELKVTQSYDFARSFQSEVFKDLDRIKLSEAYLKMRGSHCSMQFDEYKKNISRLSNIECEYGIAARSKQASLHLAYKIEDTPFSIGIQVEGTQFRKFVACEKTDNAHIQSFADKILASNLSFFTKDFRNSKSTKNGVHFCGYDTSFRYQYTSINAPISLKELFDKISEVFEFIHSNIDEIKQLVP